MENGSRGDREAWLADYKEQDGKRHAKAFDRKKDADAFISNAKVEVKDGVHTADSDSVTVAKAASLWLAKCEERGLERATRDCYEAHARLHILPMLGKTKLSKLTAPMICDFEDRLRKGGMSRAMVRKVMTSLSGILANAVRRNLVKRNVVRDVGRDNGADARVQNR